MKKKTALGWIARIVIVAIIGALWVHHFDDRSDGAAPATPAQQVGLGATASGSLDGVFQLVSTPCQQVGCGATASGSLYVGTYNHKKMYAASCRIPAAVANASYPGSLDSYCRKQAASSKKNNGGMDPLLKYIYKCGGGAVIATWFVKNGKGKVALGAAAACSWDHLFEGHPKAYGAAHKRAAFRGLGTPGGPKVV